MASSCLQQHRSSRLTLVCVCVVGHAQASINEILAKTKSIQALTANAALTLVGRLASPSAPSVRATVAIGESTPLGSYSRFAAAALSNSTDVTAPDRGMSSSPKLAPASSPSSTAAAPESEPPPLLLDRKILRKSLPSSSFMALTQHFHSMRVAVRQRRTSRKKQTARVEQLGDCEPNMVGGYDLAYDSDASDGTPSRDGSLSKSGSRSSSLELSVPRGETHAHPLIVGRHYLPLHQPPPEINAPEPCIFWKDLSDSRYQGNFLVSRQAMFLYHADQLGRELTVRAMINQQPQRASERESLRTDSRLDVGCWMPSTRSLYPIARFTTCKRVRSHFVVATRRWRSRSSVAQWYV